MGETAITCTACATFMYLSIILLFLWAVDPPPYVFDKKINIDFSRSIGDTRKFERYELSGGMKVMIVQSN